MGIFSPEGKLAGTLNRLGDLMILNGLTILLSLPLVTLGPAFCALFACTLKMARSESISPVKGTFPLSGTILPRTAFWVLPYYAAED